ncbi:MAG TPA: M23 family metallopeptidase [Polyangiaceae bacterium]|nr:M23 family metallopeptidase [Polyangiaceae bacterium]
MRTTYLRAPLCLSLAALAFAACSEPGPDLGAEQGAQATDEVVAADAFCPQGFAFDAAHQLCLSATEAAGPFPPSMVAFCRQWVPNRPDGSNACQTNDWGFPATRWARSLTVDARAATRRADGCAEGTALDPKQGYCSDGKDLYGPFSKDDVFYCQTAGGGGAACETNRIATGMARPKAGGAGEWAYIMPIDLGVRSDGLGAGHFGASRSNSAGTHSGIDFLAPVGTELKSVCDADGVQTGFDGGYGNWVQLACPLPASLSGGKTLWASVFYAHLASVSVANGGSVRKGGRVGAVGKTGNASSSGINAHVHWEVTVHGSRQAALADGHASSDNTGNAAATSFEQSFRSACLTPNGVSAKTGPIMRGHRPDPYLLLACSVRGKPALASPPPSLQSSLEPWSEHFSASGFDVNVGF